MSTPKRELSPFVERLRHAVAVTGISQRELAERSGANLRSIQDYLAGRSRMPAEALPGIAKALGVSCDYLLTGEPAALHPAVLWVALNDPRFSQENVTNPGSEDSAWFFYMAYTSQYFARLSGVGRTVPYWESVEPLVQRFIERLRDEKDPLVTLMRQRREQL